MGSTYLFSLLELLLFVVAEAVVAEAVVVEAVVLDEVEAAEVSTSYEAIALRMSCFTELSLASIHPSIVVIHV